MRELQTLDDLAAALRDGAFIVITDMTNGIRVHEPTCRWIGEDHFHRKVIENRCKRGRYYRVASLEDARREHGAERCLHCLARP